MMTTNIQGTGSQQPRLSHNARVIAQRFRLIRMLGEGGMGVVWEVIEESTGQRRAAKFIRDGDRSDVMVRRLLKEAQAVSAIRHPNVVRVVEVAIDDDGTPVILMEFLEGETLGARLEREGCLSIGQTSAILVRVISALNAAHVAGVIHRDLKPDNIFLTLEQSGKVAVRVLDFGIAKHSNLPKDSLTVTGTLLGTPLYMSPEQAGGEKDLDARSDIWSIAVILFECLTGTTPVIGDNFGQILSRLIKQDVTRLSTMRPDLPGQLIALVDGALVPRAERNVHLAAMDTTLGPYADAEILQPRTVVKSDPRLPSTGGRPDSFSDTVGLPTALGSAPVAVSVTQRDSTNRTARHVAVVAASVFFVCLLAFGGWYSLRGRTRATTTPPTITAATGAPSSSHDPVDLPPPAIDLASSATAEAPSASASASASAVASATKRPGPHPRTTAAAASAAPPPASSKPGAPTRLHGGVAGDVPF